MSQKIIQYVTQYNTYMNGQNDHYGVKVHLHKTLKRKNVY